MALAISALPEQQRLTQTPLLKIWVPWMGYCHFKRRRGCKCSGVLAEGDTGRWSVCSVGECDVCATWSR